MYTYNGVLYYYITCRYIGYISLQQFRGEYYRRPRQSYTSFIVLIDTTYVPVHI